jgi:hypothetical protein
VSHELHYTSVPRGLQPGSRGFCTVAHTQGLAAPLMQKLEGLSGYRPLFPPLDERAHLNPVAWSHLHVNVMGTTYSVLSRVCPAGLDYSERTNKFAHHVALDPSETAAGGPAWMMQQPGFIDTAWQGEPRLLARGRTPPRGDVKHGVARTWQQLAGDAGWAGVLAEATLADPNRPIYIVTDLGVDVLSLFAEALALLPPEKRWSVTFSTYFATVPAGQPCLWRWVQKDSPEAKAAARQSNAMEIDLTTPLGQAQGGALVECARTGQAPPRVASPSSTPSTHQRPGPRSTITPPRADYASEPSGRSSSTRAEEIPTAAIVPEARMGLDPWEKKHKRPKEPLAEPAPAASWPTFVGAFIGLLIVAGGAYVVYLIMTADKATTPDDILKMVSTTPRETKPTVIAKATEPVKPPVKVVEEPVVKIEEPKPPMPVAKVEEPIKPVKVEPTRPLRPRDTHVKEHFRLPSRIITDPYKEHLKDVGQVVELKLIGLDEVANKIEKSQKRLNQQFQDSTKTLKITVEGGGTDPSILATFQMQKDGTLSFVWGFKANSGVEGQRASDLVRDCVLEVKNTEGEVTYYSFRRTETLDKAVLFDPPNVSLEKYQYDVSKPLEYPIVSKPIALPNPPLRPLILEFDSQRRPVVKAGNNDIRIQKCQSEGDGFEILPETKENNHLAEAGQAANYFYEKFFIIGELAGSPPAFRGQVLILAKPQIETKDALDKKRDMLFREKQAEEGKLAAKLKDVKKPEDLKNIRAAHDAVIRGYNQQIEAVDRDWAKWKQDNEQLKRRVKPIVAFPNGVVWMRVGDLRVDIYRIMDK